MSVRSAICNTHHIVPSSLNEIIWHTWLWLAVLGVDDIGLDHPVTLNQYCHLLQCLQHWLGWLWIASHPQHTQQLSKRCNTSWKSKVVGCWRPQFHSLNSLFDCGVLLHSLGLLISTARNIIMRSLEKTDKLLKSKMIALTTDNKWEIKQSLWMKSTRAVILVSKPKLLVWGVRQLINGVSSAYKPQIMMRDQK